MLRNPAAGLLVGEVQVDEDGALDVGGYDLRYADGTSVTARGLPDGPRHGRRGGRTARPVRPRPGVSWTVRQVEVTARPIAGSDPPLVVVVFHDVTADRRERDELASFAGVVAHDLLNPLTVVEGWSETLLETARAGIVVPPEKQAEQLDRIRRAAQRMQHLISDLLAYTTARDLRITPVRVDLRAMVRDIARARVEASRVSDEPAAGDHRRPGAARRARRAGAAAPGRRQPGRQRGQVRRARRRARRSRCAAGVVDGDDGPMVLIEVVDNGIGIPEGQHARVFDTFHRAHRDGYRGTGLGLSIVKRIVGAARRHGRRRADNEGRGGTTMSVTFPAADLP